MHVLLTLYVSSSISRFGLFEARFRSLVSLRFSALLARSETRQRQSAQKSRVLSSSLVFLFSTIRQIQYKEQQ